MSTVVQVREAIFARMVDDDGLMDALGGPSIYDEGAPEGSPFPYIVLGGTSEDDGRGAFGNAALDGLENIRIYTQPGEGELPGAAKAKAIYAHVHRLLHEVDIAIDGAVIWNAKVRLVTTFLERGGQITAAPAQYTYQTMRV